MRFSLWAQSIITFLFVRNGKDDFLQIFRAAPGHHGVVLDAKNWVGRSRARKVAFLHFQGPYRLSSNTCSLAMLDNTVIGA